MRILHIAGNYPDSSFNQPTTRAVQNLVIATEGECGHLIASIKRLNAFHETTRLEGNMISLGYRGLPGLVGMNVSLKRLANRLATGLAKAGFAFDIVHAHKLTVEGVVALEVARMTRTPYVTTIRAYTDGKMLRWRPDCRRTFRRILLGSGAVFLPAPWALSLVSNLIGNERSRVGNMPPIVTLPNIVRHLDRTTTLEESGQGLVFVTVFRAGQGADKGFHGVIDGARLLVASGWRIQVQVVGCDAGSEEARWVARAGLAGCVKFLGSMSHDRTLEIIAGCSGLVLPSRNDTFGMVYVEALLSGVPILYSANAGIDGFLDGLSVGVRVDPTVPGSIVDGMRDLATNLGLYRQGVRAALLDGRLDCFRQGNIVAKYLSVMRAVVAASSTRANSPMGSV